MAAPGRLGGSPCLVTQNDLGQRLTLAWIQQRQRCVALPENEHWMEAICLRLIYGDRLSHIRPRV